MTQWNIIEEVTEESAILDTLKGRRINTNSFNLHIIIVLPLDVYLCSRNEDLLKSAKFLLEKLSPDDQNEDRNNFSNLERNPFIAHLKATKKKMNF